MAICKKCGGDLPENAQYYVIDSDQLIEKVKELIHEGNVRRIIVKNEEGKLLLEIPVTVGVIGALIAPWLAALGAIAALAVRCTIIVERRE